MKKSKLSRMLAAFLVLVMVLTMLPGTALAIEIDLQADETAPCQITEGCILADGHEGDCVVEEEPDQDLSENGSSANQGNMTPLAAAPVTDEASFLEAVTAGGEVTLEGSFALTSDVTIAKDVTLDLNGQTLTTGSYSLKISGGNLTIQDNSADTTGKITGTDYIVDMNTAGSNTVTLESGTLEGTGWSAVARIGKGNTFVMTGGIARQTQNNATYVLLVNISGTANVTGGRIEGSIRGISASAASSVVNVGAVPTGSTQTEEEAGKVYVSAVYASSANAQIALNSGTVGKVFGTVGTGFVLNCWFEQDVSSYLPAGMMCTEVDGHWQVARLTEENAAAEIDGVYYASLVKAAQDLKDNQTLILLKNYEGNQDVTIKVDNAVVDLNGYSITNTAENGYGLEITSDSGFAEGELGVTVRNSGANTATITAAIPLHAHSGNSMKAMPLTLGEKIELVSREQNGTCIELGTSAYIEYTDEIAAYITSGGFLATHDDGKQYVHGSFVQAARNDTNKTAVLLNDYEGTISINSEESLTLDLNGHTVTSNSTAVIRANTNNATLTVKNGTMVSANGTGAEVGIPSNVGIGDPIVYNNVTLNLENVDLTANGSDADDYGIVTNGTSTGIHINLKGGSVIATNSIGIYFPPADSTLTIDGTKITGTTGVAVKGGEVTISGNAEITGTGVASDPDQGADSGVNDTGAAVYVEGNYNREVSVKITGGTFTSEQGTAVQMLEDLSATGEKEIVITGGTYSQKPDDSFIAPGLGTVEDGSGNFVIEKLENVYVDGINGDDANTGADAEHAVKTLEHAINLVSEDGIIYVCGTVTVDSTLTLDGVTIKRADGFNEKLISVDGNGANLTLRNTTIDGGNAVVSFNSYLLFVTNGGTLTIENGTEILNNKTSAVYVNNNSYLTMNGGTIKDNSTTDGFGGGGIYTCGTTVINGGEISNNTASTWGGGIDADRGTLTLNGGEIKNNFAEQGAGVAVIAASAVLDGAVITENESDYYGGGVYVQGITAPAQFEMRSGSIIGNTAIDGTGAGIFGYYYDADTTLRISGGTIKENVATNEKMGSAITLYGYNGSAAYPSLQLSGSPEIAGDVFFQNDYEDGYVIKVVGEFDPVNPIEVTRSNNIFDIVAVEYAAGLTPSLEDFVSGAIFETFRIDGQTLKWADASIVYFYDENGDEYKDNRHGVIMDGKIDPADAPTPTKTGYTLAGWRNRSTGEMWDFENDTVSSSLTRLDVVWSLNAPTVNVEAEPLTPHVGTEAVLTATAGHELDGMTYTYQWYKDGVAIADATGNTLNVSEAGSYTVKVAASDGTLTSAETESEAVVITIEGHVFDDEWKYDENTHWHECGICQAKNEEAEHSFVWVIDKEATNYETGLKHEECTVCGYEKGPVVIPMTSIPGSNQGQVGGGDWDWPEGSGSTGSGNAGGTGDSTDDGKLPPNTGDTSGVALGVAILALAGVGIGATAIHGKKKR